MAMVSVKPNVAAGTLGGMRAARATSWEHCCRTPTFGITPNRHRRPRVSSTWIPRVTLRTWLAWTVLVNSAAARSLAAQPPTLPTAEWYLPVSDGCSLYVYEVGRGRDTAIVLHGGFGAEHGYMLDVARGLEWQHHFVFYDQRGSLRSPCPDSLVSVDAHIADLDRVRTAVGLRRATLIGHSMGTLLAMAYLARYPERVQGLVLTGAVPPRAPVAADSGREAADGAAFAAFRTRPAVQAELRRAGLEGPDSALSPKQRTEVWRVQFAAANLYHVERWRALKGGKVFYNAAAGQAAARTIPPGYDFTPALGRHACPVNVILGDHDFVDWGGVRHRAWTRATPHATLTLLAGAGHNAWIDAPNVFRDALASALVRSARCTAP